MGADSLSEYSIDYRLRRCFATRSLANARMLGVFPDAQADDGADYWSIPSKRCHIAWETGFARTVSSPCTQFTHAGDMPSESLPPSAP